MVTIYYTKTFTSGLKKGLSITQKITTSFPEKFKKFTTGRENFGFRDKYIITDASHQNYVRQ